MGSFLYGFVVQAAEIEQLKTRLKQYGDYDEIKRELEIMKVHKSLHHHLLDGYS
jgi:homeobox protein cut-like